MAFRNLPDQSSPARPMGRQKKRIFRSVLTHSDKALMHTLPFLNSRDVTVAEVTPKQSEKYFAVLAEELHQLSFLSENFLYGNLLLDDLAKDPRSVLRKLEEYYAISGNCRYFCIAADLCNYLAFHGRKKEELSFRLAAFYYSKRAIAGSGDHRNGESSVSLLSLEFSRLICIYNLSCAALFRYLKAHDLLHRGDFTLQGASGRNYRFLEPEFRLSVSESAVKDYTLCSDYTVTGLRQMNRQRGLGVPLVGWLEDRPILQSLMTPPGMTIPVTLCFRLPADDAQTLQLQPVYQDASLQETFTVATPEKRAMHFPLALDFTTPLACFQAHLPEQNTLLMMLNPHSEAERTGLYLIEPYNPAKIPVVCIHGLLSTPGTWMPMINALKNDPLVRRRYQFWFFSYSSGAPLLLSTRNLTRALRAAQQELCTTPEARANFEKMVILGHSMGGVMTHLLLRKDQHQFMQWLLNEPWEVFRSRLPPQLGEEIEELICYSLPPFIRRAVFLAAPHRGAKMAQRPIAKLGVKLIELPQEIKECAKIFMEYYRKYGKHPESLNNLRNQFYTGLDNLDPASPLLQALQEAPLREGVKYHSIIGRRKGPEEAGGSDGVVPYSSSHWEGVESECIVRSAHNVQKNPAAMQETLRILLLHLKETDAENGL